MFRSRHQHPRAVSAFSGPPGAAASSGRFRSRALNLLQNTGECSVLQRVYSFLRGRDL